ncbi:MAG: YqgE/AlgH family protein [Tunicatimonas sp.]|uniref:YqgE/AlgH family protein n=1 Tax=Tunicatimonas sp. TaxID=1940096 RepID=UPI003C77B8AE
MQGDAVKPAKGDLLLSEPFLADPNFERSVILLCEHNSNGSFGFVLNKEADMQLSDAIDEVQNYHQTLYVGGPVQHETLHFLHRVDPPFNNSEPIVNDVFWGGNFDELLSLINTRKIAENDVKFFAGYSGWGPGQLEDELEEKTWIVYHQPTAYQLFDIPAHQLWQEILRNMGGKYRMFSNYPIDPRLN